MATRDIIAIGASAGGSEVLKTLAKELPPDINASIFIVWHLSPDAPGALPDELNRVGNIPAKNATDNEKFEPGRIYVAPPDHHLTLEKDILRVTKGPKENRFRPAVDPLFRSAAYVYRERVIGVILSGALDDGTSGLWSVKRFGGTTVVQDPLDAEFPSMPQNALRAVDVDRVVPASEMADLLVRLTREDAGSREISMKDELTEIEIKIASEASAFESGIMKFGELSPFTCPDCHGVLLQLKDGDRIRFRCHTGHGYSADSLLEKLSENIEETLWSSIRAIEECMMLLNKMGDRMAQMDQVGLSAKYYKKAFEAEQRLEMIRPSIFVDEKGNDAGRFTAKVEKGGDVGE